MAASRWEKERAAYLLGRTRPGSSGRRRAELIGRQARRLGRSGVGVAATSMREDITPTLFHRMLATNEGSKEKLVRLIMVPTLFAIVSLVIGPAIAIGAGLYGLMWHLAPRIGRLLAWPWYLAGGLVFVVGGWAVGAGGPESSMWLEPWPPSLHIYLPTFIPTWLWAQVSLGLILTGLRVRQCGWAAVRPDAAPKPERGKSGEFIKTPDHKKVLLDPLAGADIGTGEKPVAMKKARLAAFAAETERAEPDTGDQMLEDGHEPVFADEDEAEFSLDEHIEEEKEQTNG